MYGHDFINRKGRKYRDAFQKGFHRVGFGPQACELGKLKSDFPSDVCFMCYGVIGGGTGGAEGATAPPIAEQGGLKYLSAPPQSRGLQTIKGGPNACHGR